MGEGLGWWERRGTPLRSWCWRTPEKALSFSTFGRLQVYDVFSVRQTFSRCCRSPWRWTKASPGSRPSSSPLNRLQDKMKPIISTETRTQQPRDHQPCSSPSSFFQDLMRDLAIFCTSSSELCFLTAFTDIPTLVDCRTEGTRVRHEETPAGRASVDYLQHLQGHLHVLQLPQQVQSSVLHTNHQSARVSSLTVTVSTINLSPR